MRKEKRIIALLICVLVLQTSIVTDAKGMRSKGYKRNISNKETVRMIVTYTDNTSDENKEKLLKTAGLCDENVIEEFQSSNTMIVEIPEENQNDVQERLEDSSCVENIQADYKICIEKFKPLRTSCFSKKTKSIITEPFYSYQWGLKNDGQEIYMPGVRGIDVNAERAWKITEGSEKVLVGVLDAGIDINNYDLAQNIYTNTKEIAENGVDDDHNGYIDDIHGWDFYNEDNSVYDSFEEDSHGTYVASIIGAPKNEFGILGVSPNVTIVPLKFMSTEYGGNTSDAIRAIEYAKNLGVKVINCSWAGEEYNKALKLAMKRSKILFVCASGNQGRNIDVSPMYPASFDLDNIITVGAIDNCGNMADYSNYGKKSVDVLAPGDGIIGELPDNMFIITDCTSAAAPFVTGEAALIYSLYPNMKAEKAADYIKKNVVKDAKNYKQIRSKGRIDIYRALRSVKKHKR